VIDAPRDQPVRRFSFSASYKMTLMSILVSIGLAVGPPLIYAEQAYRMQERRNSSGFSKDVCAVLLISNIAVSY
jgi:hypothetical protein